MPHILILKRMCDSEKSSVKNAEFEQRDSAWDLNRTYYFSLNLYLGTNKLRCAYGEE